MPIYWFNEGQPDPSSLPFSFWLFAAEPTHIVWIWRSTTFLYLHVAALSTWLPTILSWCHTSRSRQNSRESCFGVRLKKTKTKFVEDLDGSLLTWKLKLEGWRLIFLLSEQYSSMNAMKSVDRSFGVFFCLSWVCLIYRSRWEIGLLCKVFHVLWSESEYVEARGRLALNISNWNVCSGSECLRCEEQIFFQFLTKFISALRFLQFSSCSRLFAIGIDTWNDSGCFLSWDIMRNV